MEKLFRPRFAFQIISLFCLIDAFFFIIIGIYKSAKAVVLLYKSFIGKEWLNPGLQMVESLDSFMLGILFVIFSYGIYRIFVLHHEENARFPSWLNVHSFSELKFLLWETVLVALIVFSLQILVRNEDLSWEVLLLPGIIFLLSAGYYLVNKTKRH
ncbi:MULTISPECIES: YqhA family protein [Niastella]|uniref:YqhA family protein n=1 Tax=Niastella soli TaxID=2821487 RepID=A0ABS3YLW2_9BACT|nr:YqhA family protein [Niastella soli]MBO9198886.1 YqhA family protein [Niastella soli]